MKFDKPLDQDLIEEATRPRITCPADAAPRLIAAIGDGLQERFCVLHLDNKNAVIRLSEVYQGSANTAVMRLGEIFREAVRDNAVNVIVGHNHPSGDLTPSSEDISATHAIVRAGKLLDITVLDHLIVSRTAYLSLKEHMLRKGIPFE